MSALHDARVPRGAADLSSVRVEALELHVEPAAPFAWPTHQLAPRDSAWARMARRVYRLLTPDVERATLQNFSYLGAKVCRGAQPGRKGFQALAGLGVQTVINLRLEAPDEEAWVRACGMDYVFYPLDPLAAPTHDHVLAFLHTACDPARGQVFFHCYHGADRTGVLAACYRIAHDEWSLERALAELRDHHFHHAFQPAMFAYVKGFARYWALLDVRERDRVLHRRRLDSQMLPA